jgi:hypothetical protein
LAGCGSESGAGEGPDPEESTAAAGPASLDNPLGTGTLGTDAFLVRDALVDRLRAAGAVRVTLTGGPSETTLDLAYDPRANQFARAFTWSQDGRSMELMELADGQVCANRAASRALESVSSSAWGYIEASDLRYSCTLRTGRELGAFVIHGYALRDPVTRLAGLMGDVTLSDLGVETDQDDVTTRHLRVHAVEANSSMQQVPTGFDLWVDDDLRLVRGEFSSLDDGAGSYTATFDYDDVATVALPAAADRGLFVRHSGSGIPGFGGYMVGQFCPDPGQPCDGTSTD